MDKAAIIHQTKEHVRQLFEGEGTGHDWWHIERVRAMAVRIAKEEQADEFIVELAALLHDIADHKFHGGDTTIGPEKAGQWLNSLSVDAKHIQHICEIVEQVSFKGAHVDTPMSTLEGEIVQDADRLDAIGAIGIARAFAYGGYKQRELYNPFIKPELHSSFEAYKKTNSPSLNHFYEKLFLLKDRMHTQTGKRIAQERHHFMEQYVTRFLSEWGGND